MNKEKQHLPNLERGLKKICRGKKTMGLLLLQHYYKPYSLSHTARSECSYLPCFPKKVKYTLTWNMPACSTPPPPSVGSFSPLRADRLWYDCRGAPCVCRVICSGIARYCCIVKWWEEPPRQTQVSKAHEVFLAYI